MLQIWITSDGSNVYDYKLVQSHNDENKAIKDSGQDCKPMTFVWKLDLHRNRSDMDNALTWNLHNLVTCRGLMLTWYSITKQQRNLFIE